MISYRSNYTAIIAILVCGASSHNITRDIILGGNESAINDDIRGLTNGKAPFASPVLITESDNDLKQHYQRDPTNVYQRYSWDGYFCSTGLFGREFLTKIMFNRDTAIYYKFMDLVCEQFAQVGMRMVAALAEDGWSMTWPWPKFLTVNREFVTDMNDQTIEYSKEVMGRDDWRISAVVAHVNPETYKVIKFEFTEDFEIMWEGSKANKLSLPLKVIADFDIMDRLNMDSPEYSAPLTAKLKTLSADLLSLIGHSQDYAENWIVDEPDQITGFSPIGTQATLRAIYAAFTEMKEEMASEDESPAIPKYDDESLVQFRSNLHDFIDVMKRDLQIGRQKSMTS